MASFVRHPSVALPFGARTGLRVFEHRIASDSRFHRKGAFGQVNAVRIMGSEVHRVTHNTHQGRQISVGWPAACPRDEDRSFCICAVRLSDCERWSLTRLLLRPQDSRKSYPLHPWEVRLDKKTLSIIALVGGAFGAFVGAWGLIEGTSGSDPAQTAEGFRWVASALLALGISAISSALASRR